MATTNTTRFGLTQWPSSDDDFTREQLNADHENIGNGAAIFLSGTSATPPTVALDNTRAFYWDKTDGILYFRGDDFGANPALWTQVHPVVPSAHIHTNLQPLNSDLTAISQFTTSVGFPVRTASGTYAIRHIVVSGSGISVSNEYGTAGNPTISINSTSDNSPSTLVFRDTNGQFKIGTPTDAAHSATKSYVDTADALKANSADIYTKTNIHDAKLYQYANTGGGTGAALPSSGTRTTPRIYVQATDPGTVGAITGDIWFQI